MESVTVRIPEGYAKEAWFSLLWNCAHPDVRWKMCVSAGLPGEMSCLMWSDFKPDSMSALRAQIVLLLSAQSRRFTEPELPGIPATAP